MFEAALQATACSLSLGSHKLNDHDFADRSLAKGGSLHPEMPFGVLD